MKIVQFEQGSDAWHLWRNSGIGASDISVLIGSNPYSTARKLYRQKKGIDAQTFVNKAMQHGIDNEDQIRQRLNVMHGVNLVPLCVEDDKNNDFKASLDGYDEFSRIIFEIKCPSSHSILDDAKHNGRIPAYWLDQVLWQISIADPVHAFITLWDSRDDTLITIEIKKDAERIEELKKVAIDFMDHLNANKQPEAKKGDHEEVEDKELEDLFNMYSLQTKIEKDAKSNKDFYKNQIIEYCKGKAIKCNGYTISKLDPRTSYDYSKMKADGIDLEKYQKTAPEGIYRIFLPKDIENKPIC
jgi:putative phage-type endonuclease